MAFSEPERWYGFQVSLWLEGLTRRAKCKLEQKRNEKNEKQNGIFFIHFLHIQFLLKNYMYSPPKKEYQKFNNLGQ